MLGAARLRPGYHDLVRKEILDIVPTTAKHILDLGCGTGALGKALKKRQNCLVTGIELNKEAAQKAVKNIDAVIIDNLNRFEPAPSSSKYDCLIFADILEHLINPWAVLRKFADILPTGGTVIASIPNISHPWVISQLKKGLLRYEPAGLLDITHLRFFTKTTICQMLYSAGLKPVNIRPHPSGASPTQYLVTAIKLQQPAEKPLCTILILTFNGWEYTKKCIASIKQKTKIPYKILVIDNGSTDCTVEELRKDLQIYHIENSCNLGFSAGFNVGMTQIDTPYFVLSNSDVVVTPFWLTRMLAHIEQDKDLVCLGAVSNHVSGSQIVKNAHYNNDKELNAFSHSRDRYLNDPVIHSARVVFFFTLFKVRVIAQIGLLDEIFGVGNYEDDDYCLRVATKKLKAGFDRSVFIHHYGSRSFVNNKVDYNKLMIENKKKFMGKWHLTECNCH